MKKYTILVVLVIGMMTQGRGQALDSIALSTTVDSLLNKAIENRKIGKNDVAIPLIEEAIGISKSKFGDSSLLYARSINDLATIFYLQNKYDQAESLMLNVLEIRKSKLNEQHDDYAAILSNLGLLYHRTNQFELAELYLLKSKRIFEPKINEKNIIKFARTLNNLGILYKDMGRYQEAEKYHIEVRKIREKNLPSEDPEVSNNLNNLAIIYRVMGRYREADSILSIVKTIWENRENKPTNYKNTLNSIAMIRIMEKDFDKALKE